MTHSLVISCVRFEANFLVFDTSLLDFSHVPLVFYFLSKHSIV